MGLGRNAAAGSCKECCKCVFLLEGKECKLKIVNLLCNEHVSVCI